MYKTLLIYSNLKALVTDFFSYFFHQGDECLYVKSAKYVD